MKKIIAIILCFLFILAVAGCNSKKTSAKSESSVETVPQINSEQLFTNTAISFTEDDETPKYRIVRPQNCSEDLAKSISDLIKSYKVNIGVAVRNVSDEEPEIEYEILIGHTNREESKKCLDYINYTLGGRYNDYAVGVIGNKLVINGNCESAIINAINRYISELGTKTSLNGGLLFENITDGEFLNSTICGRNISEYNIVRPHYNSSYITQLQIHELCDFCEKGLGYYKEINDDAYFPETPYEIIVGNTNRGGEKPGDYDEFCITAKNGKVFINGGNAQSTAAGVMEFIKMLKSGGIEDGFSKRFDTNEYISKIDRSKYYTVKWFDEFDGETLDLTKWKNGQDGWHDAAVGGKTRCRDTSPEYVYQKDGCLYMQGHQDEDYYYGAMIQTPHKLAFKYGILEVSEIIPHGDGFWIALYLESTGIEPSYMHHEIDINEMFGNANVIAANLHLWPTDEGKAMGLEHSSLDGTYSNQKKRFSLDGRTFNEDFHNYGCVWTPEKISFTCDGEIYFEYDITYDPLFTEAYTTHSTYIKLGYNIGGADNPLSALNATQDQWQKSSALITDSIYIYQLDDGESYLYTSY